jgi:hypothetical protein
MPIALVKTVTQSKLRAEVHAMLHENLAKRDREAIAGRQKKSDLHAAVVGTLEWVLTLLDDPETYPHVTAQEKSDREFIERHWRKGLAEAKHDQREQADGWSPTPCPYEESSLAGLWWLRGYRYAKATAEAQ